MLRWEQLDTLWTAVRHAEAGPFYIYAVGEPPPAEPATSAQVATFVAEIDTLLRREHEHDYCGIVYVDNVEQPKLVKIYDPNHLGSSCGAGALPPPLPGWILSTRAPIDLAEALPPPGNRHRWWQRLFGV